MCFTGWYIIWAVSQGVCLESLTKVVYLYPGIANIVGCVGVVTTSRLHFDRLVLHAACILTFGAATIIIAFSSNKANLTVRAICFCWHPVSSLLQATPRPRAINYAILQCLVIRHHIMSLQHHGSTVLRWCCNDVMSPPASYTVHEWTVLGFSASLDNWDSAYNVQWISLL